MTNPNHPEPKPELTKTARLNLIGLILSLFGFIITFPAVPIGLLLMLTGLTLTIIGNIKKETPKKFARTALTVSIIAPSLFIILIITLATLFIIG